MNTGIRKAVRHFYDDQKFPRGFHKSGDFTLAEAEALTIYGVTMRALESGSMVPESEEEKRFVLVVENQLEASSVAEKAWAKYVRLTRSKRHFHTLTSRISYNKGEDNFSEDLVSEVD